MGAVENYNERMKRIDDAIALKEPDRVPIAPFCATFPFTLAGYSCKDTNYDIVKAEDAFKKYITRYEPDMVTNPGKNLSGQMTVMDQLGFKFLQWAGEAGTNMPDNTCFQFIDKEYLLEEEYPEFIHDRTGWTIRKYLPRAVKAFEPLQNIDFSSMNNYAIHPLLCQFGYAGLSDMFRQVEEAGRNAISYYQEMGRFEQEIVEMGYIPQIATTTTCAFDSLQCIRGTIPLLMDTIDEDNADYVKQAINVLFPGTLYGAMAQAKNSPGKLIMIPMIGGTDDFMSKETFAEFYWPTLLKLINGLVDAGFTPWVYTEGHFNNRYEFLKQLPKGKCLVHFEKADMRLAKRELGDIACLSGGINSSILMHGTKESVADAIKENMDILAPGGGYIFDVGNCLDQCKPELVDVMFDTLRKYGTY